MCSTLLSAAHCLNNLTMFILLIHQNRTISARKLFSALKLVHFMIALSSVVTEVLNGTYSPFKNPFSFNPYEYLFCGLIFENINMKMCY